MSETLRVVDESVEAGESLNQLAEVLVAGGVPGALTADGQARVLEAGLELSDVSRVLDGLWGVTTELQVAVLYYLAGFPEGTVEFFSQLAITEVYAYLQRFLKQPSIPTQSTDVSAAHPDVGGPSLRRSSDSGGKSPAKEESPRQGVFTVGPKTTTRIGVVALADLYGVNSEAELDWMDDALCAQTDPEAFFPEKGGSTREVKRVCSACEVRQECLDYALANDERHGIWGGKSERERRKLKKLQG